MTPQEGSSLLKSCPRRSFSFTRGNSRPIRIALATHGLRNTALDRQKINLNICFTVDF